MTCTQTQLLIPFIIPLFLPLRLPLLLSLPPSAPPFRPPPSTSEFPLSAPCSPNTCINQSKHCHDTWATERLIQGWTWGDTMNDDVKTHPNLIPYEILPESEKKVRGEERVEWRCCMALHVWCVCDACVVCVALHVWCV